MVPVTNWALTADAGRACECRASTGGRCLLPGGPEGEFFFIGLARVSEVDVFAGLWGARNFV